MSVDDSNLPLIDADRLFLLRGRDCVADVALPDGTLPINGQWRMEQQEWARYRADCAADADYMRQVRAELAELAEVQRMQDIEREGCAS